MRDDVHRYVGFCTICDIPQPRLVARDPRSPRVCLAFALRKVADRHSSPNPSISTRTRVFFLFFFFLSD